MPSERAVRYGHAALFTLTLLASIVALAISASLVKYYNDNGYPPANTGAYRDRIRILLTASTWSTAISRELRPSPYFISTASHGGCARPGGETGGTSLRQATGHSRVLLTSVVLLPGFFFLGHHLVFGILTHLIGVAIAFILFIIGASSLTALTRPIDCGRAGDSFSRCNIVKGLVIISWIDT